MSEFIASKPNNLLDKEFYRELDFRLCELDNRRISREKIKNGDPNRLMDIYECLITNKKRGKDFVKFPFEIEVNNEAYVFYYETTETLKKIIKHNEITVIKDLCVINGIGLKAGESFTIIYELEFPTGGISFSKTYSGNNVEILTGKNSKPNIYWHRSLGSNEFVECKI
ncbi:MAG: hypothetical protein RsTaC01_0042 [Candidatus Paraimprobicoccus trichonymphae]|uniref:Uncharacterized protein n=1 Tax=Candidatus Paraimprobicoccus trichonymphae TaxID=3033793 RepID=A0AA48I5A2_9FIRM|nr:MAG: hypothetical protein RsTaC01_0042 [Candidatus Paraimprobicoccus trichonymphae]